MMEKFDLKQSLAWALDVSNHIALVHLRALLGVNLNKLSTKSSGNGNNLAPRSLDEAERIALVVARARRVASQSFNAKACS